MAHGRGNPLPIPPGLFRIPNLRQSIAVPARMAPSPHLQPRSLWLYFMASLAVTVACFFMPDSETGRLVAIGLSGAFTVIFLWILMRGRRFAPVLSAAVPLGIELPSTGLRPAPLALLGCTAGPVLLFIPGVPEPLRACGAILLTLGLLALAGLSGHVSQRSLRLDPGGLTITESGYEYQIPWQAMGYICSGTYGGQPFVGFDVLDRSAIRVAPGLSHLRMRWAFKRNYWVIEKDVMIFPSRFALQPEALRDALRSQVEMTPKAH
jgi:hypothetical protein